MNSKVGSKSCIWLLWVTANMWKLNFPKLHVTGAYPVNLFSLNGYNFSSLVSRTSILQEQLIFSLIQLFFSEGQLMYLENKSCTTEKKSSNMKVVLGALGARRHPPKLIEFHRWHRFILLLPHNFRMVKNYFFEVTQNRFYKLIMLLKVYMPSN